MQFCFSQFFNQVLMLGKTSVSDLSEHVFDLILELYNIDSHLLLSVLPQLEFKLKVGWSGLPLLLQPDVQTLVQ